MGVAAMGNKQMLFVTLMTVPNDSKRSQASLSPITIDWLRLQIAPSP